MYQVLVSDILLPVFETLLKENQPTPPLPDNVDLYIGTYEMSGVGTLSFYEQEGCAC